MAACCHGADSMGSKCPPKKVACEYAHKDSESGLLSRAMKRQHAKAKAKRKH